MAFLLSKSTQVKADRHGLVSQELFKHPEYSAAAVTLNVMYGFRRIADYIDSDAALSIRKMLARAQPALVQLKVAP